MSAIAGFAAARPQFARSTGRYARNALWVWVSVVSASLALSPLVQNARFAVVGAVTAAVVLMTSAGLRALGARGWAIAVVQVVVLVEYATVTFFSADALGGVIPVRATARALSDTALAAFDHAQKYPSPVPPLHALDIVVALGVAAVAIGVDVVAVSLRRPALAGLIFLGIYMVPVSLLSGHVSMWAFIPGAVGFVFLLAAIERDNVLRWGGGLDAAGSQESSARGGGLEGMGRRVGLGAVACAVVIPLLVPTLPTRLFGTGGTGGDTGTGGDGPVSLSNPMLDMRRNLTGQSREPLVRVASSDGEPTYLRLTSLPELTDAGWAPGERQEGVPLNGLLPPAPGASSVVLRQPRSLGVTLLPGFSTQWLPTLYAPTTVAANGPWTLDRQNLDIVRAAGEQGGSFSYTMTVSVPVPDAAALRNSGRPASSLQPLIDLPAGVPAVVRKQADRITADAGDDFDKALALQQWFRTDGGFTYDLSALPVDGWDTIAHFVTDDRRGYCEQFATAMAIMARAEGIPARVAVGFLRPERESATTYVFRGTDAHAWPELYFRGTGWVRFEPTPGGSDYRPPDFSDSASGGGSSSAAPRGRQSEQPKGRIRTSTPTVAASTGSNDNGSSIPGGALALGGIALLLLAIAAVPRTIRELVRRRRWGRADGPVAEAEAAWSELGDVASDLGIWWDDSLTPRRAGTELGHRLFPGSAARDSLDVLVEHVEQARYSPRPRSADVRGDLERIGAGLAEGRPGTWRWRARFVPLSWVRYLRRQVRADHAADGEDLVALRG